MAVPRRPNLRTTMATLRALERFSVIVGALGIDEREES
jgi:hypothetical protein